MKSCSPIRSWIITRRLRQSSSGNWCLDWRIVLVSSLRPSQAGTLDLDGAFRFGNHGRCAQLLPENGPSQDHSVALREGYITETSPRSSV